MPRDPETSLKRADDYRATLHHSSLAHIEDASVSAFRTPPSGYETHHQVSRDWTRVVTGCTVSLKNWQIHPL